MKFSGSSRMHRVIISSRAGHGIITIDMARGYSLLFYHALWYIVIASQDLYAIVLVLTIVPPMTTSHHRPY